MYMYVNMSIYAIYDMSLICEGNYSAKANKEPHSVI